MVVGAAATLLVAVGAVLGRATASDVVQRFVCGGGAFAAAVVVVVVVVVTATAITSICC